MKNSDLWIHGRQFIERLRINEKLLFETIDQHPLEKMFNFFITNFYFSQ